MLILSGFILNNFICFRENIRVYPASCMDRGVQEFCKYLVNKVIKIHRNPFRYVMSGFRCSHHISKPGKRFRLPGFFVLLLS